MEKWSKDTFEQGDRCQFCHVVLSESLSSKIPAPKVGEQMWLDNIAKSKSKQCALVSGVTDSSRLACQVMVTEDFRGTTVFVVQVKSS